MGSGVSQEKKNKKVSQVTRPAAGGRIPQNFTVNGNGKKIFSDKNTKHKTWLNGQEKTKKNDKIKRQKCLPQVGSMEG